MAEFQIHKNHIDQTRLVATEESGYLEQLSKGDVLARVERFGLSANNVTYAVMGHQLNYWAFFPASKDAEAWGLLPVWGFAEIIESRVDGIKVGERLFGYFPSASHLIMTPVAVNQQRLVDGAPHRAALPDAYNLYRRVASEPGYDPSTDDLRMLFWPLYMTSFLLWDFLQDQDWQGAEQIVMLSASSKTSLGVMYAMQHGDSSRPTVALTSEKNLAFVNQTGLYDQARTYGQLDQIDANRPTLLIDMSGNDGLKRQIFERLGENLIQSIKVGLTHHDQVAEEIDVMAERSHFFFAPNHVQKRLQDWGGEGFATRSWSYMQYAMRESLNWLKLTELSGLDELTSAYQKTSNGLLAPEQGVVLKL